MKRNALNLKMNSKATKTMIAAKPKPAIKAKIPEAIAKP